MIEFNFENSKMMKWSALGELLQRLIPETEEKICYIEYPKLLISESKFIFPVTKDFTIENIWNFKEDTTVNFFNILLKKYYKKDKLSISYFIVRTSENKLIVIRC